MEAEERDRRSELVQRALGQIFALLIVLSAIAAGPVCLWISPTWPAGLVASVIGGGALVAIVRLFILGQREAGDRAAGRRSEDEAA